MVKARGRHPFGALDCRPLTNFGLAFTAFYVAVVWITHAVVLAWAMEVFPRLRRHRRASVALVVVIAALQPVTRAMTNYLHSDAAATVHVVGVLENMAVGIASIPIAVMLVAGVIARRRREGAAIPPAPLASVPPRMTRRQAIEGTLGVGFLAGSGACLGWGVVRGRHAFAIEELVVKVPGLSPKLDGYTIAQISDLHAGIFVGEDLLAGGLARVKEARADILVVTGDLVDFDAAYAPKVARMIKDFAPRDGVFAILGNHDYYADAAAVSAAVRAAGIELLTNEGRVARGADGGGFALLGVDDLWAAKARISPGAGPDLAAALGGMRADVPRILLSHQPQSVELWPGEVALQLSGHTHGGQINPLFSPAGLVLRYLAGRYDVGGTALYVNRGFGTAGPPSRVGAPPEVTRVVLVAG